MKSYNIAVIPGDGTGPEVVKEGIKVMNTAAAKFGFTLNYQYFDFGGDRYLRTGETLPDSAISEFKKFDSIFLGAIFAVFADNTATIQSKNHREVLDANIMQHLVIGPLQKGGINGYHRTNAFHGQTGGEGDGVLFTDPHIKKTIRVMEPEIHQAGAVGHGRSDSHNTMVLPSQLDQGVAEYSSICGKVAHRLFRFTGLQIKATQAVKAGGIAFGRFVAFALGGEDMDQDRPGKIFHVAKGFQEMVETMALNRSQVIKLKSFKEHAGRKKGFKGLLALFGPEHEFVANTGHQFQKVFKLASGIHHGPFGQLAAQKGGEGADVGRYRHFVVV